MHELTVTQNLLDLALRYAEEAGASRIVRLHLIIGDLSSVIDDSVAFYWDVVSQGTLAEGAELCFTRVAARLRCQECQAEYVLDRSDFACPECRSLRVSPCSGTEFLLESIEIDKPESEQIPQAATQKPSEAR